MPINKCAFCGNSFKHKLSKILYCSPECRKKGIGRSHERRHLTTSNKTKPRNSPGSGHRLGSNPGFPRESLTDSGTKALAIHVLRSAIKEHDLFFVQSSWCEFWCDLARIDVGYFREHFPLLINSEF